MHNDSAPKRSPKQRCTCDAIGSGICPDCRAIVQRRLDAAQRHRNEHSGPQAPAEGDDPVDGSQVATEAHEIADRLVAAARLLTDGRCSLDAVSGLVAATVLRIERLAQVDELVSRVKR